MERTSQSRWPRGRWRSQTSWSGRLACWKRSRLSSERKSKPWKGWSGSARIWAPAWPRSPGGVSRPDDAQVGMRRGVELLREALADAVPSLEHDAGEPPLASGRCIVVRERLSASDRAPTCAAAGAAEPSLLQEPTKALNPQWQATGLSGLLGLHWSVSQFGSRHTIIARVRELEGERDEKLRLLASLTPDEMAARVRRKCSWMKHFELLQEALEDEEPANPSLSTRRELVLYEAATLSLAVASGVGEDDDVTEDEDGWGQQQNDGAFDDSPPGDPPRRSVRSKKRRCIDSSDESCEGGQASAVQDGEATDEGEAKRIRTRSMTQAEDNARLGGVAAPPKCDSTQVDCSKGSSPSSDSEGSDESLSTSARQCRLDGCSRVPHRRGLCRNHYGQSLCTENGCTNIVKSRGRCSRHGGGKQCTVSDCKKKGQGGGFCVAHGGRNCLVKECRKKTRSRSGFCCAHGGSRNCAVASCPRKSRGAGKVCKVHRLDHLCKVANCERLSRCRGLCLQHDRDFTLKS